MIVASYERDPGNAECLIPVVPKNHPITNTADHYINAPRTITPTRGNPRSPNSSDKGLDIPTSTTRLDNIARQTARPIRHVQRTVANTVIGQMLPSGVMKGGAAMSVRVGEAASRFTTDLDAARHTDVTLDDYLNELARRRVGRVGRLRAREVGGRGVGGTPRARSVARCSRDRT